MRQVLYALKILFIVAFILVSEFSGWPPGLWFPQKIEKANAGVIFVQSAQAFNDTNPSTVTFPNSVAVNDVIAVFVAWDDKTKTLNSVTDDCGPGGASNTYTRVDNPTTGAVSRAAMAYAVVGQSGPCDVSANFSSGLPFSTLIVHELSGVDTGTPLDGHAMQYQTAVGPGTDVISSGSIITHSPGDYIFGATDDDSDADCHCGAGTGYSMRQVGSQEKAMSEDTIQASPGSVAATFLAGINDNYITGIMAFQPAQGYQVSNRSDTLSDSRPSATSNHTVSFTTNKAITGSSTITLAYPPGFTLSSLDCGDIDAATSSQFNFNYPGCAPTATAWGATMTGTNGNFVQKNADQTLVSASQWTVPFVNNVTKGNLVVVVAMWNGSATALSVTDTLANVFTAVGPAKTGGGVLASFRSQLFYAKNINGGAADSVTIKMSASVSEIDLYLHEYTGADQIAPLDVTSVNSGTANPNDSGSKTTNFANELIFGFDLCGGTCTGPGSGFVMRSGLASNVTEDKVVRSIGSYSAFSAPDVSGQNWVMWMATFKITPLVTTPAITLTAPTDSTSTVHVATGTPITIKIGSNATYQQSGQHWITNPSTAGTYTISIGGTFGGSGNMLVAINSPVTVKAQVAESLALTVSGGGTGSFPTTSILDNFNRADEAPLGNGTWSYPVQTGHSFLKISSNVVTTGGGLSDAYWSAATFGPDSEVFVTLAAKPSSGQCMALALRIINPNSSNLRGYWFEFCDSAGTDTFDIYRIDNNAFTDISSGAQELSSGDSIGASAIGSALKFYYKIGGGAWTQKLSVNDSTYAASGYIGLHIETGNGDNFGGGTVVPACTPDDGAAVTQINTTATSVPFGTISPNTFYQGCQDLTVSTNAGGGYSLSAQESSALKTADGSATIPDTKCDSGTCSSAAGGTWVTPTNTGFGYTCNNRTGSDCDAQFSSGVKFKPVGYQPGTIGFVQGNAGSCSSCSTTTIPFNANTSAGNLIVVAFDYLDTQSVLSVTDTQGNVYTRAGGEVHDATGGFLADIYYAKNITGGANSVTVNFSGSASPEVYVHEYAGLDPLSPLDVTASSTGSGATLDSGSATTHYANELIFGWGPNSGAGITAGSGFSARSTFTGNITEDKIVGLTGSYNATATHTTGDWSMQMAAFKQAASGISFVQSALASCSSCTATTASFSANVTPGDLIVVGVNYDGGNSNAITSLTGSSTDTFVASPNSPCGGRTMALYYAKNSVGGYKNIQVKTTNTGNGTFPLSLSIHEYAGADKTAPFDSDVCNANGSGSNGVVDGVTSGAATLNSNNELLFGMALGDVGSAAGYNPGTGFMARQNPANGITEDTIVSGGGSKAATMTAVNTSFYSALGASFKAATPTLNTAFMSNTSPVSSSTGRVKYRLSVPSSQAAGTYSNLVTYTIWPTY